MGGTSRAVTDTPHLAGHQGEPVRVQHGVESLQRDVAHLHGARQLLLLVRLELVAESRGETQLPGDVGQVDSVPALLLHLDLAGQGAQGGRTEGLPRTGRVNLRTNMGERSVLRQHGEHGGEGEQEHQHHLTIISLNTQPSQSYD